MDVMMRAIDEDEEDEDEEKRPPIPSATVCTVEELAKLTPPVQAGTSVCVCGRVESYDAATDIVVLRDKTGSTVRVITNLLPQVQCRVSDLVDAVGEVQGVEHGCVHVRARLIRSATSRDVDLFTKALAVRRQFLAKLGLPGGWPPPPSR